LSALSSGKGFTQGNCGLAVEPRSHWGTAGNFEGFGRKVLVQGCTRGWGGRERSEREELTHRKKSRACFNCSAGAEIATNAEGGGWSQAGYGKGWQIR